MLKKTLLVCGFVLSCVLATLPAAAQEPATFIMRSGERISGKLLDLGAWGSRFA